MFAIGWIGITWKKFQHFFFQLSGIGAVTLLYALWNLFESCSLQVFPWSYFPCLLWVGCVCILARKRESLFRPIGVLGVCCTVLRNIIWLRSHFAAFSSDAAIQNWNLLLFVGYAVLAFALLTGTSRRDAKRYPLLEMICHAGVVFALLFQIDAQVSGDIRQTPIVCIALGLLLLSILFQYFWRMYKLRHLQVASDVRWTSLFLPTFAQLLVLLGFWAWHAGTSLAVFGGSAILLVAVWHITQHRRMPTQCYCVNFCGIIAAVSGFLLAMPEHFWTAKNLLWFAFLGYLFLTSKSMHQRKFTQIVYGLFLFCSWIPLCAIPPLCSMPANQSFCWLYVIFAAVFCVAMLHFRCVRKNDPFFWLHMSYRMVLLLVGTVLLLGNGAETSLEVSLPEKIVLACAVTAVLLSYSYSLLKNPTKRKVLSASGREFHFWIAACASVAVAALCVPHSQHFVELWVFVSGNRIYYTWLLSPLSCYPCVRTGSRDDQHLQADSAGYLLRPAFPESGELPVLRSTLSGNQFLLSLHDAKVQEKGIRSRRKSKRKCKKIK